MNLVLVSNVIGYFFDIVIVYYLYENFFHAKAKYSLKIKLGVYILAALFGVFYSSITYDKILRLFGSFINLAIPYILYTNKVSYKLLISTIWLALTILAELMVKALLLGYVGEFSLYYQNFAYNYLLGTIFSRILTAVLTAACVFVLKVKEQKLPIHMYVLICLIPLSSAIIFYQLQEIVEQINDADVYITYCVVTFVLLLFNLIFVYLFSQTTQTIWLKAQLAYEENLVKEQHTYHNNLAVYHQKVRQLSHDMHNHFLILYHALKAKEYNTAEQYVESHLTELAESKTNYTGYLLLDTVLDYKQQLARNKKIHMQVHTNLQPELSIPEETMQDICIMLGSCLDNAIEAAEQVEETEMRRMKLTIKNDAFYLTCRLENSIRQPVTIIENQIPTTMKSDNMFHGLGLQNVKRLAEKHNGYLLLESSETVFVTSFALHYR